MIQKHKNARYSLKYRANAFFSAFIGFGLSLMKQEPS